METDSDIEDHIFDDAEINLQQEAVVNEIKSVTSGFLR